MNFVDRLLDHAKVQRGLTSDAQLSKALGVSRAMVSFIRTGASGISPTMLEQLLEGYGEPIERGDLLSLMVPELVTVIRRHDLVVAQGAVTDQPLRRPRART
jgi:transcriptional regulator with XRE-family HTH domain